MELISEITFGLNSTPITYSNSIEKNYQRVVSDGFYNFKDQILDEYFLVDLKSSYKLYNNYNIDFSIKNLFDKNHENSLKIMEIH